MSFTRDQISVDEIVSRLNQRADTLAPKLLPAGRREGRFWVCGSVNGDQGNSLKVVVAGAKKGLWTDFATTQGMPEHGGNMLHLVAIARFGGTHKDAWRDAVAWAKSELGLDDLDPERLKRVQREIAEQCAKDDAAARKRVEKMRDKARHLWFSATDGLGTPAELYLRARGFDLRGLPPQFRRWPRALRYHPEAWCSEVKGTMPCMVAGIWGLNGEFLACHRTYLDIRRLDQGIVTKAQLRDAKLTMGTYAGGHLPLWKGVHDGKLAIIPHGTDVYVSEGIEDGLSVAMAFPERRIVAGVALSNIGGMEFPDQLGRMVLIGQNDTNEKTIAATEASIARQQKAGRKVATIFPAVGFKDFNDQLCGKQMKVGGVMAEDWKPGDLALYVGNKPDCPTCCGDFGLGRPRIPLPVLGVIRLPQYPATCGLLFKKWDVALCSCGWIKPPDYVPDADDAETIRLLSGAPLEVGA